MPGATTKGAPYPVGTDAAASIDTIVQSLAQWVTDRPGIQSVTTSERDALSGVNLWTGRVVYNNQTQRLQVYNGTTWTDDVVAVGTTALVNLSVTEAKLADDAVTQAKMANNSVGSAEIIDGSVTPVEMGLTTLATLVQTSSGDDIRINLARFGTGAAAVVIATISTESLSGTIPAGAIPAGWRPTAASATLYGIGGIDVAPYTAQRSASVLSNGTLSIGGRTIVTGFWVGAN